MQQQSIQLQRTDTKMAHLYDNTQDDSSQPLAGLKDLEPDKLVAFENNNIKGLLKITTDFAETLDRCQEIVVAAYSVADYMPSFQTEKQSEFWKNTVIPILVKSLKQDIEARVETSNMFTAIRNLALVIKSNYDIVRRSRGSAFAIEIARKNITAALNHLKQCIVKAELLSSSAIADFASNSEEIFQIIGPEAAKFAEEKEKIDQKIRAERKKQQDLYDELGKVQGEVKSTFFLIEASEKQLSGVEIDLQARKDRLEQMKRMNHDLETTIQNNIAGTVKKKTSFGFFLLGILSGITTSCQESNANREEDQRFYEGIIKSRMERIKTNEADDNAKVTVLEDLKNNLAAYKKTYERLISEMRILQENLPKQLKEIEDSIDKLKREKEQIEKSALDTFEKIGLMNNTLISCLAKVRTFAQKLKPGASVYQPLCNIMSEVKSLVEGPIGLLFSDSPSDVFLAGFLLIEQVNFLSEFTTRAQQIMKPSDEYEIKQLELKTKKALAL